MLYLIVLFNLLFLSIYVYLTRNRLSYIHFLLLIFLTHNIIRPIALFNYGESIIYSKLNLSRYPLALFLSSIYYILFFIGYEIVVNKGVYQVNDIKINKYGKLIPFDYFNFLVCSFIIIFLFKNFGVMFLAFNRIEGISAAFPETRYLYPFALISSALLTARGIILIFNYKKIALGVFLFMFGAIVTTIINQRGFAISFVFIAFISVLNYKITFKKNIFYFLFLLWFLAFVVRELPAKLFSKNETESKIYTSYTEKIVSSADGDSVEVWLILLQYIDEKGYSLGKSVFNNIYNIFYDNKYRLNNNKANGLDLLNDYWFGSSYVDLKFGFNMSTSQELYLNFGIFSLIIIFILGIVLGFIFNFSRISIFYNRDEVYEFLLLFSFINLFSSFAGLQWTILCLLYYIIFRSLNLLPKIKLT